MANPRRLIALMLDRGWGYDGRHGVLAGIQQYARQHRRWHCVFDPFPGDTISARRRGPAYDGIIAHATPRLAAQAGKAAVPVVNVWHASRERTLPRVVPDLAAAGRMAADHLIARGLMHFAFLGYRRVRGAEDQLDGFRAAVARAGATCDFQSISVNSARDPKNWGRMNADMSAWMRTWKLPIGVCGAHDLACRYLIDACLRHGLRVPEDVAIVGLGNNLMICDEPHPTLSSVELDSERIGFRAAELLDRLMRGESPPAEPIRIEPCELVMRNSTDLFAGDDPMVSRAMQFIVRHGDEPTRAADVVAALPISRRSLERRFRLALGSSIEQEIRRLRLMRAKRLIVGTNATITAIAASTGFCNYNYFNAMFQKSEGMTPGAFRRGHATAPTCRKREELLRTFV